MADTANDMRLYNCGGAAGDVLLNVNVTPSSEFERKGQNVYSTIRVPFTTAALGGKVLSLIHI